MTALAVALIGLLAVLIGLFLRRWGFTLLGPLFRYEVLRSSRHVRVFSLRCLYAGALFLTLYLVYASWFGWDGRSRLRVSPGYNSDEGGSFSINDMADFGRSFAYACLWVQLLAAIVLTPILTAGVITEERGRRTLDFLLLTHLHDREIVVGKLAARLSHVGLILVTGLPLLGLVQLLGGVDPNLVLAAFIGTLALTISIGSVAVFNSVKSNNTPHAIAATYYFCSCYFLGSMFFLGTIPGLGWLADGNPFAVVAREYANMGPGVTPLGLPEALLRFVVFHILVALFLCRAATRRLRRLDEANPRMLRILREKQSPLGETRRTKTSSRILRRTLWPPSAENLLWWKELSSEGAPPRRRRDWVALIFALIGINLCLCGLLLSSKGSGPRNENIIVARSVWTTVSCSFLLAVALNAARTFSRERTRRTLESLFATPVENRAILWPKMFASIVRLWRAWALVAWMWIWACLGGGLSLLALPLLAAAWMIYAVVVAEIGVLCSLACRNTLRATVFTLAVLAGVSVVPLVLGLAWKVLAQALGWPEASSIVEALWLFGASPPLTLWGLAFTLNLPLDAPMLIGSLLGMCMYAVIAWLLWRQLNARFGRLTGRMPVD